MKKVTQKERVLGHLKKFSGITSLQAYDMYGITRLAAVIFDLRACGNRIKSTDMKVRNRYGDTCVVTKYSLEESDE